MYQWSNSLSSSLFPFHLGVTSHSILMTAVSHSIVELVGLVLSATDGREQENYFINLLIHRYW